MIATTPYTGQTSSKVTDNWLNLDPLPDLCPELPDRRQKKRWLPAHGSYLPEAHNRCFEEALRYADWDRVLVLENDMIFHQHLVARARTHQADIVSGIYFMRRHPPTPVLWKDVSPDGRGVNLTHLDMAALFEAPPGEHEIGAVPTGILSVARHVVELMERPWFETSPEAAREGHKGGHDLYFSAQARRQGFTIAVDTSPLFVAGHLGESEIGVQHYLAYIRSLAGQQQRKLDDEWELEESGVVTRSNGGP